MHQEIDSMTKRLDATFMRASENASADEIKADLARYLCVLVSGHLEESLRILLTDFVEKRAAPEVRKYTARSIREITSLKETKLKMILESFSPDWIQTLDSKITSEHKDAIDSVVNNRHLIAHGKQTGISLVTVGDYWVRVKELIRILNKDVIQ